MSYTSRRVGVRQWRVLLAVDTEWPGALRSDVAGKAIGDCLPFSAHKPVIQGLIDLGLLEHIDCPGSGNLWPHCTLRITDQGAMARRDRKASNA